ncbi:nucleotidyltransferase family protein [Cellulomonas carbonis]|nr:nucleotidyltransferase family protein [Cellulomonas carbonis]GGC05552.1 hypothetical protein GCM10010972_18440 [Cellulomonas carbonis]
MTARTDRDPAATALVRWLFRDVAGTASDVAPWPAEAPTDPLVRLLDVHRGWTFLARRAASVPGLPADVAARAVDERRSAVTYQVALAADLLRCGAALDAAGVPWVCVKGPVVAALHEARGEVRPFTDLDLLVPPERFADALRALSTAGSVLLDRNFALLRSRVPGEVDLRAPLGTMLDLHWTLVNRSERRRRAAVPTARLLATRVDVTTAAGPVPALGPAERLVHLCLHAAGSGGDRLVWLLDVALACAEPDVDWDAVVATARAWRVARAVGLVLGRSGAVLGAPVPGHVVAALRGRGDWAAADVLARRLDRGRASTPARRTLGAHLAAGSLEHDRLASLAVHRSTGRLRHGRRAPFTADPADPGSAFHADGTVEDLHAYLAAVAAHGDPADPASGVENRRPGR